MYLRSKTFRSVFRTALTIVAVVVAGCGGVTVLLGGDQPYDGFYYDYRGYSYYDSYWYYDDYSFYNDNHYFVDYVDSWGCVLFLVEI